MHVKENTDDRPMRTLPRRRMSGAGVGNRGAGSGRVAGPRLARGQRWESSSGGALVVAVAELVQGRRGAN
jgi:hypothetical protein